MHGGEVLLHDDPEVGDELLLLLDEVLDHLLAVADLLGQHRGRVELQFPAAASGRVTAAGRPAGALPGRGHVVKGFGLLVGYLCDVVGGEPAGLSGEGALPPAAVLLLGEGDDVALLEVELE